MSLIPNESHGFPDLDERAGSTRREPETLPEDAEPENGRPRIISDDAPDPILERTGPVPISGFADPREAANSPPIPQRHAQPVMPAMPVVPDQLADLTETIMPQPNPIGVEQDDYLDNETPDRGEEPRRTSKRRRHKLIRFIVFEGIAIGALLLFAKLEVNERFSANSFTYLYGTAMLISAIAAALIPVIFYALPPTLPPGRQ